MNPASLLEVITRKLDRGGSPDSDFPDREGEYWALCPFYPDKHPENFSVSEADYHCFACGASGGLWALAEKLGVAPHAAPRTGGMAGGVALLHANSGGKKTPLPPRWRTTPPPSVCRLNSSHRWAWPPRTSRGNRRSRCPTLMATAPRSAHGSAWPLKAGTVSDGGGERACSPSGCGG